MQNKECSFKEKKRDIPQDKELRLDAALRKIKRILQQKQTAATDVPDNRMVRKTGKTTVRDRFDQAILNNDWRNLSSGAKRIGSRHSMRE
jgi:guanylate kinase